MLGRLAFCSAIAAIGALPAAQAAPLIDFSNDASGFVWYGNDLGCSGGCTLGYAINVRAPITVDGLGVYDSGSNGLVNTHEVGLWTAGGALLASGAVGPGASGEPSASGDGTFRYTSIAPLTLGIGIYVVGALFETGDTDPVVFEAQGIFSNAANVSYSQLRFVGSASLQLPTNSAVSDDRYFGPTLRLTDGTVPEPTTLALLGLGLAGLAATRRRKQ